MTNILYLIKKAYELFPNFRFFVILILFLSCIVAIICLLFMTAILLLDLFYRPNIPQYPFNIILDRIIPVVALFCPTVSILLLQPENNSWIEKFFFIILVHCFILIPLFYYWSKLRNWLSSSKANMPFITWTNPQLYFHIAVAMIYPAIGGIYFSLLRYLRLGQTIDFTTINFQPYMTFIIVVLFIWPLSSIWIRLLLWCFMDLRLYLWNQLLILLISFHIYLLRFNFYFRFMEILFKISFVWYSFLSLTPSIYPRKKKYPKYRYLLQKIYMKPQLCWFFVITLILLEFISKKGILHYSIYLLFMYAIIYSLVNLLYSLYTMNFVEYVCMVDYFNRNWNNPRYPTEFWVSFEEDSFRYFFNWSFSDSELLEIRLLGQKYLSKKYRYYPTLITRLKNRSYCMRLKGTYRTNYGIRWVHTTATPAIHSATSYFLQTFAERAVLLQSNWQHYKVILKAEKLGYATLDMDKACYINFHNKTMSFRHAIEENLQTNFLQLKQKQVLLQPFKNQELDTTGQKEPDLIVDFTKANFNEKRVHGMDQKSGHSEFGRNIIFSNMEEKVYLKKLKNFFRVMQFQHPGDNLEDIAEVFRQLGQTCNNISIHQMVWASNLHLFPKTFIPPMKVPEHFSIQDVRPEFLVLLQQAKKKMIKVSDYLYYKQIPQVENECLPEKALDLFQDSFFVKLLQEE